MQLLIADDHPLYRDALRGALALSFSDLELLESQDLNSTLNQLEQHRNLDLLLLDLNMPGASNLYGLIHIRRQFADLPIAIVSGTDDIQIIHKAISAGAQGFIPKTADAKTIAEAITHILEGDIWLPENLPEPKVDPNFESLSSKVASLTQAQYKVLNHMKDGLLNKQIAAELEISEATVKAHITAIFKKLNINNRSQAVLIASQLQL